LNIKAIVFLHRAGARRGRMPRSRASADARATTCWTASASRSWSSGCPGGPPVVAGRVAVA